MPRYVRGIVVEASMDRMGSITVRPKSDKWARRFRRVVVDNGGPDELTAFFQEGFGVTEFMENDVPKRYRQDLEQGWTVRWIVDPWVVGHWYGYDAHTAAE